MYTPGDNTNGVAVPGFLENLSNHVHGATTHFPIALLFVSAGLDLFASRWPGARSAAWLLLVLGAVGTVLGTLTGLAAHLAYENVERLHDPIERHQNLGFATTAVFVGLTAWRWRSLRLGKDIGGTRLYLLLLLAGLVVLGLTGFLGGNLNLDWGVGVRGVTR